MINPLIAAAEGWTQVRVLVLGEAMLDSYLQGSVERVSREAPIPIVALRRRRDVAGGAANTAVNVAGLCGRVTYLSVTGDDEDAARLRGVLAGAGVPTHGLLADRGRQTLVKHRLEAEGQLLVRFDAGSTDPIGPDAESRLIAALSEAWPRADAVVISDYGYGIVTGGILRAIVSLQRDQPRVLVIDARDLRRYRPVRATAVKPNYDEACRLLGLRHADADGTRVQQMLRHAGRLGELTGAQLVALTLDREGTLLIQDGVAGHRTACRPAPNQRAMGAGDTYAAALALGLASGVGPEGAADLAAAAASVVVSKPDTATCSRAELCASLGMLGKRLETLDELEQVVALHRGKGERIVFTNGCFDLLHAGHLSYLHRARSLGDVLIVGVNSDASVQRLKGPSRPLNSLDDRLELLSGLSCVDHVIGFDEDTPAALIDRIAPEVYAKGGDYTRDRLPEAGQVEALGGRTVLLPFVPDRSTSRLIARAAGIGSEGVGRAGP